MAEYLAAFCAVAKGHESKKECYSADIQAPRLSTIIPSTID